MTVSNWQDWAALALVALAFASLCWRWAAGRRSAKGCGSDCGCKTGKS